MKKNNKKDSSSRPRVSGKAKFLVFLMFLQTILANAREGIVLRTISSPTESRVMLDTTNDGRADMYVSIPRDVEPKALYEYIRDFFDSGSMVEIDDDYILSDGNMDFSYLGGVLTIDNINPIKTTHADWLFEAAAERMREEVNRRIQSQRAGR